MDNIQSFYEKLTDTENSSPVLEMLRKITEIRNSDEVVASMESTNSMWWMWD